MKIKIITASLLQIFFCATVIAQQSNLNEDYSAYLPEVRNLNKLLDRIPAGQSILTKEGLGKQEKG